MHSLLFGLFFLFIDLGRKASCRVLQLWVLKGSSSMYLLYILRGNLAHLNTKFEPSYDYDTGFLTHFVLSLLITLSFHRIHRALTISNYSYRRPQLQGQNRHPATKIGPTLELRPVRNPLVSRRPVRPAHSLLEGRNVNLKLLLVEKLGAEDNIARMRNLSHESNRHWRNAISSWK